MMACRVVDRLRYRRDDRRVFLYAYDPIELNGEDLRREPIERRKAALGKLMRQATTGLVLNEHIDEPGNVVFRHACKLPLSMAHGEASSQPSSLCRRRSRGAHHHVRSERGA